MGWGQIFLNKGKPYLPVKLSKVIQPTQRHYHTKDTNFMARTCNSVPIHPATGASYHHRLITGQLPSELVWEGLSRG